MTNRLRLEFLSIENFKSNTRSISISVCEKPTDLNPPKQPRNEYEKFLMEVIGDRDLLDNSDVNASNVTNIIPSLLTIAKSNLISRLNGKIELGEKDHQLETTQSKTLLVNIFTGDRKAVLYQGELVIPEKTESLRVYYVYLR